MTVKYVITLSYADIYSKKVTVEATSLEEALQLSFEDESDFDNGFADDIYVEDISQDAGDHELQIQVHPKHASHEANVEALKLALSRVLEFPTDLVAAREARDLLEQLP